MKKEFSYKQLQKFDNFATSYLIKNGYYSVGSPGGDGKEPIPAGFTNKENTKLSANIRNIIKQWQKCFAEYKETLDDLELDHCAVDDKTKVVLTDSKGQRMFTPEKAKLLKKAIREFSETNVVINVRITEGDWELTDEERDAFNGLVIPEFNTEE